MNSGVYEIINTITGRRYIGSTRNLATRYFKHLSQLRRGIHDNAKLQAAWNKYGEAAFAYRTLENCAECDLMTAEQRWLDLIHSNGERHYNVAPFANSGAKGRSPSAETRAKQSASVLASYDEKKRAEHSVIIKAAFADPELVKKRGQRIKEAWAAKTEAEKEAIREARRAGIQRRKTELERQRRSAARKAAWADSVIRERMTEGLRAAGARRRSKT